MDGISNVTKFTYLYLILILGKTYSLSFKDWNRLKLESKNDSILFYSRDWNIHSEKYKVHIIHTSRNATKCN